MNDLTVQEIIYITMAFVFQAILVCHFALRKWNLNLAIRYGVIVYAASIPAALTSIYLLLSGMSWYFYLGGFIYLIWASYGYYVEYVRRIQWRSPIRWTVFGPYVSLYLSVAMFFWWPLATIDKSLWYGCAVLFLASTLLNISSHHGEVQSEEMEGVT
jgi:hypothetical protein